MQLFDTHAHLDSDVFEPQLEAVVARARAAGVAAIVAIGTTAASSRRCVEIAGQFEGVYAAVGIQPNYVAEAAVGDWEEILRLAREPKVVALGETGLDRYWQQPFEPQQDYFRRHLELSQQTGLPVVIHMRDCGNDVLAMLREAASRGAVRGVMHSYTGDQRLAEECLVLGLHISFAGMVTYKKSDDLRQVAAAIPGDRILIETDAPYLSPHPQRSVRPNEPALLVHTAQCLAAVRGVDLKTFAGQTCSNAQALFRLAGSPFPT
jgi:TatD DNase family protein